MAKFISLTGLSRFKDNLPNFIEGEGFIKNTVSDLVNYYTKSETYTQNEVQTLIAAVKQFTYEVVDALPTASASTMHKIYLVPSDDPGTQNIKDEYITIDNGASADTRYTWEKIGSTAVDLSNYPTTEQMTAAIAAAVAPYKTEAQIKAIVEAYGYETSAHAAATYVEKVTGMGLSSNDYTTTEKNKLAGISSGAQVNVLESISVDSTPETITNKNVNLVTATNAEIDSLFD